MKASLTGMEGDGFYNRHSSLQAAAIQKVLPLWRKVVDSTPTPGPDVRLVDYGSSQGHNSMAPVSIAIETLRGRVDAPASMEVVHTDLPGNDFTSLFRAVLENENSYLRLAPDVFPSAIGRSYFEQILPDESVDLGWNSWTLQWMSRNPAEDPDFLYGYMSPSPAVRAAVARQLDEDWRNFLGLRARELKRNGRLFCLFSSKAHTGSGWEWIVEAAWSCVLEMRRQGKLSSDETLKLNLPLGPRDLDDIERPFREGGGAFAGLTLEHAEIVSSLDPFWIDYQKTGDAKQFGLGWKNFMKAVFAPVIKAAIDPRKDAASLCDELLDRFAERVSLSPRDTQHYVAVAVVRKGAAS
ncbi:MAG: SAM-dependent methyltransferase [Methylocystis sp.]|uniref:SAM-dependent methyltransferase n=1 Tax=Methylocystis sp. TaxID=1911079 RepID=UPI003DA26882